MWITIPFAAWGLELWTSYIRCSYLTQKNSDLCNYIVSMRFVVQSLLRSYPKLITKSSQFSKFGFVFIMLNLRFCIEYWVQFCENDWYSDNSAMLATSLPCWKKRLRNYFFSISQYVESKLVNKQVFKSSNRLHIIFLINNQNQIVFYLISTNEPTNVNLTRQI